MIYSHVFGRVARTEDPDMEEEDIPTTPGQMRWRPCPVCEHWPPSLFVGCEVCDGCGTVLQLEERVVTILAE